jgi:hypothetical protein
LLFGMSRSMIFGTALGRPSCRAVKIRKTKIKQKLTIL